MALGDSYATKAQLKARLGITDTNDDVAIDSALATSTRAIEGVAGRQFNDAGVASARIYYPDDLVTITTHDFSTLSSLAVDFSNSGTYSSVIASGNYQLEPLNGVVDGTPGFPFYRIRAIQTWLPMWWTSIGYPRASVQVTAQWGWAAVPTPVIEACLMLAEDQFKRKDAPWGIAGTGTYGLVRVREDPKVMALLNRYMRSPIQVA